MDAAVLSARHLRSQRAFYRALGERTPRGQVIEHPGGVLGAVVPARPERSVLNAVVYDDPAALLAAREALDAAYVAAGVHAWTVWVRPEHDAVRPALEAVGHRFDAQPMLMGATLSELDLEPRFALDLDPDPSWEVYARVNDAAYELDPSHSFADAFVGLDDSTLRRVVARLDGRPVATAGWRADDGNCEITFVATVPAARGRGLASELMRLALRDALAAGCSSTTLEATAKGEPVYARLGYRSLGRLGMYELRRGS